jgi:hypothetical protein
MNLSTSKAIFTAVNTAAILILLSLQSAYAGLLDFTKSTTETKETFLVYDLAEFSAPLSQLEDKVKQALIYRGDNAIVTESLLPSELPKFPAKIEFKKINFGPVSMSMPSCPGSAFVISSSDASGSSYGESARYMACAFPYAGGYRINFYASYVSSVRLESEQIQLVSSERCFRDNGIGLQGA